MANLDPSQPSAENAEQSHATKGLLRLTMACNERCPFCNVPVEDYERPTPPMDQVFETLQQFIDRGDQTLTISGGEPTLSRKRLIPLVERAKAGGIRFIEVQTNAVLVDDDYARAMAEAGVTSAFVSLLSHDAELHDELAGLKGAFPRCIAGIDAFLNAGIRVALNPVTAASTQEMLPDYVDFVAERLPRVRSISLSAVQPHGRAAKHLELMPDYAQLTKSVHEAQKRAVTHGLELLNPYCGLPLCIGWSSDLVRSVEAIEATAPHNPQGVDNHGNKRHGPPCTDCGLRPRCGGAWHAYWDLRQGSGLTPPWTVLPPWAGESVEHQEVIDARNRDAAALLSTSDAPSAPTRWLWVNELEPAVSASIRWAGITHIAFEIDTGNLRPTLSALRRISKTNSLVSPQRKIQTHGRIGTSIAHWNAQQVDDLIVVLKAVGLTRLHPDQPGPHASRLSQADL